MNNTINVIKICRTHSSDIWHTVNMVKHDYIAQIMWLVRKLTPDDPYVRVYDYGKDADVSLAISMDDDEDLCVTVDVWDPEKNFGRGGWETIMDVDGDYYYSKSEEEMERFRKTLLEIWETDFSDWVYPDDYDPDCDYDSVNHGYYRREE